MRSQQDMRRMKSLYHHQDQSRPASSKGWQSGGSENSVRVDSSPRSNSDAMGACGQSCSPQSSRIQGSPLPPTNGFSSHEGMDGGNHLASLFHRSIDQSGNIFSHQFLYLESYTWPFVASQWYQSGMPNETMQMRLEKQRDIKIQQIPTAPSHFLKPLRQQEGTFIQVHLL